MKLKKLFKYYVLGESLKEIEVNRILDKVSKGLKLLKKEKNFLELYNDTKNITKNINKDVTVSLIENKDFMLLSKSVVSFKIKELLDNSKKVICDLHDRDGKIGVQIEDVVNNFDDETSFVIMKDGNKHTLHEKFLYNLIYNNDKNLYSLQEHDEYFEKIEAE